MKIFVKSREHLCVYLLQILKGKCQKSSDILCRVFFSLFLRGSINSWVDFFSLSVACLFSYSFIRLKDGTFF